MSDKRAVMSDFEPISGQKLCEYSSRRFGWRTIASNGCSVLAIYNALGLCGYPMTFEKIHAQLHRWYRPRWFGIFPWRIRRFFKKNSIACRTFKKPIQLEPLLKTGGAAVLTYWNATFFGRIPNIFAGAHSVAVHYDGRFTVYNRFSNRTKVYSFNALHELLHSRKLIKAFYLTNSQENT